MIISLTAFAALNFLTALSGAYFRPDAWFRNLEKPSWQPPDWAFPVVWMVLYALNAFSGWLVWKIAGFEGIGLLAMLVYGVGLVINASWSAVFFGLKRLYWAKVTASVLWVAVALQIIVFSQVSQLAALLLIPYLVWVMIATALSSAVWRLNPGQDAGMEAR